MRSWVCIGAILFFMLVVICFCACVQVDSKHEAANAYAEAGHAYKKTSPKGMFGIFSEELN